MQGVRIQLGARVRRRNDIGLDTAGAVVRVNGTEIMVYWPQDSYYEVIPVAELELYGVHESIAA